MCAFNVVFFEPGSSGRRALDEKLENRDSTFVLLCVHSVYLFINLKTEIVHLCFCACIYLFIYLFIFVVVVVFLKHIATNDSDYQLLSVCFQLISN